ncbi:MAG: hypothetical protein U0531_11835 [Dehalococcoidia bacterium]
MMKLRVLPAFMLGAALMVFSAACNDGNDRNALENTYKESLAAVNSNNGGKSYDLLSKRCRDRVQEDDWEQGIKRANAALGQGKLEVASFEVVSMQGNEAVVRSSAKAKDAPPDLSVPTSPREYRMVKEDGKWRIDDCNV